MLVQTIMRTRVGRLFSGNIIMPDSCPVKQFRDYDALIQILIDHGLIIDDQDAAKSFLKEVNYYRFSGYFLTFKNGSVFYPDVTFEIIRDLYYFDHELKILLLKYIAHIEIAFRNAISHCHAEKYGPIGYLKSDNFDNIHYYAQFICNLDKTIKRSNDVFVAHHKNKYGAVFPVWVAVQTITIGALSKLYDNMLTPDKKHIAKTYFNSSWVYVSSWFKSVADLRNICAHWGRLYNRPVSSPKLDGKKYPPAIVKRNRVFCQIVAMYNLLSKECQQSFRDEFKNIIATHPNILLSHLGCNGDWEDYLR